MLTDEQREEIDRIMRAIGALAWEGVEIQASITYRDGNTIINDTYDSKDRKVPREAAT